MITVFKGECEVQSKKRLHHQIRLKSIKFLDVAHVIFTLGEIQIQPFMPRDVPNTNFLLKSHLRQVIS